jgi:hypothetical protein
VEKLRAENRALSAQLRSSAAASGGSRRQPSEAEADENNDDSEEEEEEGEEEDEGYESTMSSDEDEDEDEVVEKGGRRRDSRETATTTATRDSDRDGFTDIASSRRPSVGRMSVDSRAYSGLSGSGADGVQESYRRLSSSSADTYERPPSQSQSQSQYQPQNQVQNRSPRGRYEEDHPMSTQNMSNYASQPYATQTQSQAQPQGRPASLSNPAFPISGNTNYNSNYNSNSNSAYGGGSGSNTYNTAQRPLSTAALGPIGAGSGSGVGGPLLAPAQVQRGPLLPGKAKGGGVGDLETAVRLPKILWEVRSHWNILNLAGIFDFVNSYYMLFTREVVC